jgi:hypothetical protein
LKWLLGFWGDLSLEYERRFSGHLNLKPRPRFRMAPPALPEDVKEASGRCNWPVEIRTGVHSGWQSPVEKACDGKGPFFRVHSGPHRLNLVSGKTIAALRSTGCKWLDKHYVAVKLLREQANLFEKMGSQSPYHVVRWFSLHQVLL